jgi:pyridinium-3,5-biscarboxylic acid mononucleotide synthase
MNNNELKKLLGDVKNGNVGVNKALKKLAQLPYEDLDTVKIDTHRSLRKGFAEVILGSNKTVADLEKILGAMSKHKSTVLVTKLDEKKYRSLQNKFADLKYYREAMIAVLQRGKVNDKGKGTILVITAGTSDIPIAEEAFVTCKYMGNKVVKVYDVGVAGIHRLLDKIALIQKASVIVVVAGMEGALASVVGGLTSKPVIAVPTSVGYGSNFRGLSALLGMLNSCSPGISVVNIDNGFGAGYFASLINRR